MCVPELSHFKGNFEDFLDFMISLKIVEKNIATINTEIQ